MTSSKIQVILKRWGSFYILGFILVAGIKYFYSRAGADELRWILAPTAWWVRHLGGIPFAYEAGVGYINYDYRFIIAPSCSGVQFMMIAMASLMFSFVHRMGTIKKGLAWTAFSLGISYFFTILVNGLRITASIYLPLYVGRSWNYRGLLTQERLHTLIGIAIYFSSLLVLFHMADRISLTAGCISRAGKPGDGGVPVPPWSELIQRCVPPLFWYFSIVLGLPLLNRAHRRQGATFTEYALLMSGVCLAIVALYGLAWTIRRRLGRRGS